MEDGVDAATDERGREETAMAADNGDAQRESAFGVDGDSQKLEDGLKDLGDSEIFEEALEPPTPDSRGGAASGAENAAAAAAAAEPEESVELTDPPVGDTSIVKEEVEEIVEPEKFEDSADAMVRDQRPDDEERVDVEKFDGDLAAEIDEGTVSNKFVAPVGVLPIDQGIKEQVAVESVEEMPAHDESSFLLAKGEDGNEYMLAKLDPVVSDDGVTKEIDEVTNGSSIIADDGELTVEDSSKEFVGKKSENKVTSDKCGADSDIESIEQIHRTQQTKDVSVQPVDISTEPTKFHQLKENSAGLDNGFATNGHAVVQKEDSGLAANEHATVEKEGSSCSHVTSSTNDYLKEADISETTKKLQREFVENTGHSGSTSPLPSSSTSNPENFRGPGLSSNPAGLGSSAPLLEPTTCSRQQSRANDTVPRRIFQPSEELPNDDEEENDEIHEKLQMIRVKFLRLAHRLGQTPHNVVVAQALYRLGLAEQLTRNTNRPGVFSFDRASVMAEQLEAAGQETLDFSCTIMVIGKTGIGKSATINSIFDEVKLRTDTFQLGTRKVQEVVGMVQGIKVRVIDTPGLFSSSSDRHHNEKILNSVKRFINKSLPDIVLYFDRLDMQSRDSGDASLLRTITDIFGASIWFNAIVVLTHAASAPPDGPNGNPLSYETFVNQQSHVVQQAIRQAAGDVRLMNPVSLVENHSACRMNRAGQRVLPNGQVWKPQLLLLSFASKILAEANTLLKLQDGPPGKTFGSRPRVPPLPFLLSSLLQSRPYPKLPEEQFAVDDNLDEDLEETSDSDECSDSDELPPFKPLSKSQVAKLSKAQKKAYLDEPYYRERLLYKKQLKEEKRRQQLMKKMADMSKDLPNEHNNVDVEEETSGPASLSVPMPDLTLPNSFDSDNPTHRCRFLDSSNQWLVKPVTYSQGWDHDIGCDGLNIERVFVIKDKIRFSLSGQLVKDKKECFLQMEVASSIKHSESKATSLCLDMQSVGNEIAYTFHGETRFRNFKHNNTAAGVSVTVLGHSMSAGLKFEDKLTVSRRLRVLMSGGAMTSRGDVAYGGRLEATLRDKDYPIGQTQTTLALSIMDWHGDIALGCSIQSQFPLGRGTNLIGHANMSNKGTGQIGIRLNSSEHLQIVLLALVPILRNVHRIFFGSSESM